MYVLNSHLRVLFQETLTVYMKESSILAANVYITMLRLPGYTCIQLFHPTLFQKSIDALKNISPIESVFGMFNYLPYIKKRAKVWFLVQHVKCLLLLLIKSFNKNVTIF